MDLSTRRQVWNRAGGQCEISGAPLGDQDTGPWECHHRRNKGMGGTSRDNVHNLSNLLALTPAVHNGGPQSVHGRRSWSEARGYLLPKRVDHPGMWPVLLRGRYWVLLGDDGQYHPLPPGFPVVAPDDLRV